MKVDWTLVDVRMRSRSIGDNLRDLEDEGRHRRCDNLCGLEVEDRR